jgi:hypothetical protein
VRAIVSLVGVDDDGVLAGFAERILEVVVDNNRYLMRKNPGRVPPIYQSGVRFRPEPWAGANPATPPIEQFCPYPELLARGWADCAQLCPWVVAEAREHGDLRAKLRFYCRTQGEAGDPERRRFYHVETRDGSGRIWDPSRLLDF